MPPPAVEHSALLEIFDKRRGGLIDFFGLVLDPLIEATMVVPITMIELDDAHAALGKAPGKQAVRGKKAVSRLGPV
jgi:hypothetical protein